MRFLDSSVVTSSQLSRLILWSRTINEHLITVLHIAYLSPEVAGGFTCPAAGEVSGASGSFSRHAHPDDCRKYYICLEGIAREYGCPIGTVFKIGDADGSGACEDPEDVPGWWVETSFFFFLVKIFWIVVFFLILVIFLIRRLRYFLVIRCKKENILKKDLISRRE